LAQDLADRTNRLYQRNIETLGGTIGIPLNAAEPINGSLGETKDWELAFTVLTPLCIWTQIAPIVDTGDGHLLVPIPNYFNCSFDQVEVSIRGAAHGGGWPPANMPVLDVWDGAGALLGSTTCVDGQVVYEGGTIITVNFAAHTLNHFDNLWLHLRGESGANSVVGLELFSAFMRIVPV